MKRKFNIVKTTLLFSLMTFLASCSLFDTTYKKDDGKDKAVPAASPVAAPKADPTGSY